MARKTSKKKQPTAYEIELKNFRQRLRYWAKKGYQFEGQIPKTAKGLKNFTYEKIKKHSTYSEPAFIEPPTATNEPVDDVQEAIQFVNDIFDFITDYMPTVVYMTPTVSAMIDDVKHRLRAVLQSAISHYGEQEFARWVSQPEVNESLYNCVTKAIDDYRDPNNQGLNELATLLNQGPLTIDQSQSFTEAGVFNFLEDELNE